MNTQQHISQVSSGQKITAIKTNQLIEALNRPFKTIDDDDVTGTSFDMYDPKGQDWRVNEHQSKLNEGKLDVKNTYVFVNGEQKTARQMDNVSSIDGTWWVGVKKSTGTSGTEEPVFTNNIDGQDDYQWQRVFTIKQVKNGDFTNPVLTVKYHTTSPTFGGIGDGGGGGGGGETQGAFRWSVEYNERSEKYDGTFKYCNFQFGRKTYQPTQGSWTIQIPEGGCTFYLYIYHSSPGTSSIVTQEIANTLDSTTIPLITVTEQGVITNDYRGMPVIPVWGTPEG